jgi:hypothetical protein
VVVRIRRKIFYLGKTSLERGAMADSDRVGVGAAAFTTSRTLKTLEQIVTILRNIDERDIR